MNKYEDPDINFYLNKCFYLKLKSFGDAIGVKINPNEFENNFKPFQEINCISINDNIDYPSLEEINKIKNKYGENENEIYTNEIFNYNIEELDLSDEININEYFPIIDDINFISEKMLQKLYYFLQTNECQMKCFKKRNNDKIFNILNNYIQKYLLHLYYSPKLNNNNKINTYNSIIDMLKDKRVIYEDTGKQKSMVNKIFQKENIEENLDKRIKKEIKILLDNDQFFQFKYITTIIIGKSGLGNQF